jgi:hypothetical protein
MTLGDQLEVVDETIAQLERRRTEIIHRMYDANAPASAVGNLLQFPNRASVVVASYGTPRHAW